MTHDVVLRSLHAFADGATTKDKKKTKKMDLQLTVDGEYYLVGHLYQ